MKNNKLFLKIYASLIIIIFTAIIVLHILGSRTRVGYLGDFKFDNFHINRTLELNNLSYIKYQFINTEGKLDEEGIKNYIFTNENITNYSYGFKVQYYNKVFRHSDIYGVYIDTNKVLQDNNFINEINVNENGSPFGNLISSKKIDFDKIDNVNYILKLKIIKYCISFLIVLLVFICYKNIYSFIVKTIVLLKNYYYKNENIYIKLYLLLIGFFTICIIVLFLIGLKNRNGYLDNIKLNVNKTIEINNLKFELNKLSIENDVEKENYLINNTNKINLYSYDFVMNYNYDYFKNNYVYYINYNLTTNFNYIKSISINNNYASSNGNFISYKKIDDKKIENINYILKVRYNLFLYYIVFVMIFLVINYKYIKNKLSSSNIFRKNIKFKLSTIIIIGYIYLILSYIIFVLTWIKLYISIPILIILAIALYSTIKDTIRNYKEEYNINLCMLIIAAVMFILWMTIYGVGMIFPQSWDMLNGKNAVFRDLINYSWPIIYSENNYGLVYYIGQWVVPAIFGKLFGMNAGNIFLILWTSFGIFISFILILQFINLNINKYILISIIIFIVFSPLPEQIIFHKNNMLLTVYTNNIENISLLYNQVIAVWLIGAIFLHLKNSYSFALLGLSSMLYSPYAIIGIFPFMIIKLFIDIDKNKFLELKNIFSLSNILSSISIFPIIYLYFSSNMASGPGFKFIINEYTFIQLFDNYLFSFGIFFLLLLKYNNRNYIFYVSIFVIILVSLIRYSWDWNFHRTNIISFFFLSVFTIKYFYDTRNIFDIRKCIFTFIVLWMIIINIKFINIQFNDLGKYSYLYGRDEIMTLNYPDTHYISAMGDMKSNFFKYIAKVKIK
ncbi:hypothetical protein [uncultured Brachyspira sp.]|uniref:hypothetical protein n=1 Tax=uncultured Brachyspira sp. TaxID=221953 RepID=UPI002613AAA3|nr:hypothetical protein [uncultured Brachyspira sp.]